MSKEESENYSKSENNFTASVFAKITRFQNNRCRFLALGAAPATLAIEYPHKKPLCGVIDTIPEDGQPVDDCDRAVTKTLDSELKECGSRNHDKEIMEPRNEILSHVQNDFNTVNIKYYEKNDKNTEDFPNNEMNNNTTATTKKLNKRKTGLKLNILLPQEDPSKTSGSSSHCVFGNSSEAKQCRAHNYCESRTHPLVSNQSFSTMSWYLSDKQSMTASSTSSNSLSSYDPSKSIGSMQSSSAGMNYKWPLRQVHSDPYSHYPRTGYELSRSSSYNDNNDSQPHWSPMRVSASSSILSSLLSPEVLIYKGQEFDCSKSTSFLHKSHLKKTNPNLIRYYARGSGRKILKIKLRKSLNRLHKSFSQLLLKDNDEDELPTELSIEFKGHLLYVFRNCDYPPISIYDFHSKLKDIDYSKALSAAWRDEILPQGMQILAVKVASPIDQDRLSALINTWNNLYKNIIPCLEALMCHTQNIDIRGDLLKAFKCKVLPYADLLEHPLPDDENKLATLKQIVLLIARAGPCIKCEVSNACVEFQIYGHQNDCNLYFHEVMIKVLESDYGTVGVSSNEIVDIIHLQHTYEAKLT